MDQELAIMQQMQQAQAAPEPGQGPEPMKETTEGRVRVGISSVDSAGHVYIYNTRTFERSICNRNMVPRKLEEQWPDDGLPLAGGPCWTTIKPAQEPHRGTVKCMLHPDNPERAHYDALGFGVCRKHNLTSMFQRTQHMKRRHPVEWETLQQEAKEAKEDEEREYQRSVIKMAGKAAK